MTTLNLGDAEAEFRVFASALRNIFSGEPWERVEPHAQRVWTNAGLGEPWERVVDRIRETWHADWKSAR